MPFRHGYEGLFDAPTRVELQEVFEFVWQIVLDTNSGPITKNEVATIIVRAHNAGMTPDAIKEAMVRALELRRRRMG